MTHGAKASGIVGAANSSPQDKGMPLSGSTGDKQATCDNATDSDPPENDGIFPADFTLVRVHTKAVMSTDIAQVSACEQVMPERVESTSPTAQKTAVFTDASDASYRPPPQRLQLRI